MTEAATATKAPPAWMKRNPLERPIVAATLNRMAELLLADSKSSDDNDVAAGLAYQAGILARVAGALERRPAVPMHEATVQALGHIHAARLNCARATTAPEIRARYMDEAHALREAMRYLAERER